LTAKQLAAAACCSDWVIARVAEAYQAGVRGGLLSRHSMGLAAVAQRNLRQGPPGPAHGEAILFSSRWDPCCSRTSTAGLC